MANNQYNNGMEHQQRSGGRLAFHNTGIAMQLYNFKGAIKMAQVKILCLLCDFFGIPITILGIIANIDNVKSAILAILGICYLMMRGYFYFVQKRQSVREKEIEIWHKEQDKQERINKNIPK